MLSMLLTVLFAGSALFALAAMALTWRQHGPQISGLRAALRDCPVTRDYRFVLITTAPRPAGSCRPVLRPLGQSSQPALRAA